MTLSRRCLPPLLLLAIASLIGCSSSHDLNKDGFNPFGGGFADEDLGRGVYHLTAKGNMAPWPSFGAAVDTWRARADQLCGKDAYRTIVETQDAGYAGDTALYSKLGRITSLPKYNATIGGYIFCNSSGMTVEEATKYLGELAVSKARDLSARQKLELAKLGGSDCNGNAVGDSPELYFRRGKVLIGLGDYKPAMHCFIRAQEAEKDTSIYRDACASIGTMYELGWGVDKDLSTANTWFKKAGLL